MDMVGGLGSALGIREKVGERGRERQQEVETPTSIRGRTVETARGGGRRGANTPSPRCITPVENVGSSMGSGRGRLDAVPRFGMI